MQISWYDNVRIIIEDLSVNYICGMQLFARGERLLKSAGSKVTIILMLIGLFSTSGDLARECTIPTPNQVATYPISVYENVTTHEGDLIVNGTRRYSIMNCTFLINGKTIIVEDSATLLLLNARLIINQPYKWPTNVLVDDTARLDIQNASIESNYAVNIIMRGHSKADITRLTLPDGYVQADNDEPTFNISESTLHAFCVGVKSKSLVSNSQIGTISLDFDEQSIVGVVDMRPGFYEYWKLWENKTVSGFIHPGYELVLRNTGVQNWIISVDIRASVTIENSTMLGLQLEVNEANIELNDLKPGYYFEWSMGSLNFKRCQITVLWYCFAINSSVKAVNCTLGLQLMGQSSMTIRNSKIVYLVSWQHSGSLKFENVVFEKASPLAMSLYNSCISLSGDVDFENLDVGYRTVFSDSKATRNFNLVISNREDLASNADLKISSNDGTLVWEGKTDIQGKANFNLTFTDSNYTETLRLEAKRANYSASVTICFLSRTPIVLAMKYFADLNGDGIVNIFDIYIIAKAFNSELGHPRWNETADINKDGIINIQDVYLIAKAYGKTV